MLVMPARFVAPKAWPRASHPKGAVAECLGVVLLFTILTALVFRQSLPHLGSALIGPPEDNMQDFWNTWYVAVGRQSGQFFFTDLLRYPEGTSLYLHTFAYPKVLAIALLTSIVGADFGTLVLLQNISLLMSFALAGVGAYYLARHLTGSSAGALLGGFVFAFNPSHVAHALHHAGVASIEFIPPFVLCYLLAIERKSPAFLALAVVFHALSALSSWYYLVYLAYFIVFHSLYVAVRDRRLPRGWDLVPAVVCPVAAVAILTPLLVPMARTAMGIGSPAGSQSAADLLGFTAFPRFHALAPLADGLYRRFSTNEWEATVYLGLANISLLAWVCLRGGARSLPALPYALCGIGVFCVAALGGWLQVLGRSILPLPEAALSSLPLFSVMRAPSRIIVLAYLFLAIAVAGAVRVAWQHRGLLRRFAVVVVTVSVVADYVPSRALAMTPVACPAGLEVIRDDPERGFGVLDLPPHKYEDRNFYMAQQVCHGRPIVLGNLSRQIAPTLGDRLDTWTVASQRTQLVSARVKYVVIRSRPGPVRTATLPAEPLQLTWQPRDAPPAHYAAVYRAVHESPELTIFRVY